MAAEDPPQLVFRETSTGVKIAEIALGSGADNAVGPASKVTFHMVGRLAGRQGWVFENSQLEDDPYRLDSSQRGAVVAGLVEGLQGMRVGGKRRIIVPSAEGYVNREVEPVSRDFLQAKPLVLHLTLTQSKGPRTQGAWRRTRRRRRVRRGDVSRLLYRRVLVGEHITTINERTLELGIHLRFCI